MWDPAKDAENKCKHRVSFALAAKAFNDEDVQFREDRVEDGEQRWHALGLVEGYLLLLVVHTIHGELEDTVRISLRERRKGMSGKSTRAVVLSDEDARKPLTPEQRAEVQALKAMPDAEIDFSDIPRLPQGWSKGSKRFEEIFRPRKQPISLRMDADVLEWLKAGGDGWQTRINAIVRERMLAERDGARC